MLTESQFTKQFCKSFESQYSGYVVPYVGSVRNKNGVADRWLCCREFWNAGIGGVWIEFKGSNRRLEPLQVKFLNDVWARCPGISWVLKMLHGEKQIRLIRGCDVSLSDLQMQCGEYVLKSYENGVDGLVQGIVGSVCKCVDPAGLVSFRRLQNVQLSENR